jgi:hypothetical protein
MREIVLTAGLCAMLVFGTACKKQQNDKEAIRAGIMQHLNSLKSFNLSAMEMDVKQVTINGTQAQAQVEFRPKSGAPPGAGMHVGYTLEKREGTWAVVKSQAIGGEIIHPGGSQPSESAPGSMPDELPPGHPPVKRAPETPKSTGPPKG